MPRGPASDPLHVFHPAVQEWFRRSFPAPTPPQTQGWPVIARGESTLILAPTGTGKTLAAFLWCINRLMFSPQPPRAGRCRVLYVSPLKALAVDVERNLRAPIAGIADVAASRGDAFVLPAVMVRTGDTPAAERSKFRREPADIVITTPESLYLLLTSNARAALQSVDTVIVDEIHALVATKRGAHLALSLERLVAIAAAPPQRIGLSATQRPLDEVARFLGGAHARRVAPRKPAGAGKKPAPDDVKIEREIHDEFASRASSIDYRPVTIVDAGRRKPLELTVEVPVEDLTKLGTGVGSVENSRRTQNLHKRIEFSADPTEFSTDPTPVPNVWSAIYPRLLELIRQHRSTLVFVNSRRLAERLASALNELAGETLVRSHHGSLARAQRLEIEELLKAGQLRALAATSSLELGIDMGAVDLVVQIEAPPSVASGLQRIGRAGHQIDAPSRGVIFPKFRGDLVASATATRAMREGLVEPTRYPRNPLDVLAQQIVAMTSMDRWQVPALFSAIRCAAPFADLSRDLFDGVLDMLAGRYPSDEFAELRPRITWNRIKDTVVAREGARRVAVINAGTIPDRGLYGVFLASGGAGTRVGELDEEMVFESRVGETFLLGASTWRIEEITPDRVLVSPAPGEPGKMPFWRGDAAGRPLELGRQIGALVRTLQQMPEPTALERLTRDHDLEPRAAGNLLTYLRDQTTAIGVVPDDRTIVMERTRDELGDWRVCVLSPLGGRVHAPWSIAIAAKVRQETGVETETMWTDDGFVVRFPESDAPPDARLMLPRPEELEPLVVGQLGSTALFAARFREAAARALLLPRRRPGGRAPLWQQRKRAADLLAVAARFGSFPMLLETYRECLRDVFDIPALVEVLRQVSARSIRVVTVDSERPSPFAASLLFGYVANYIYEGDAPLAERRAQALSIDQAQLQDLLGEAELRELLDPAAIEEAERQLQQLGATQRARTADGIHDLLLRLGDLTLGEIAARSEVKDLDAVLADLEGERRIVLLPIGGEVRFVPVEYAAQYRDALGVPLPEGLPGALLGQSSDAIGDLARRYARTHSPFPVRALAARYQLPVAAVRSALASHAAASRLLEGEFRPGGTEREWCHPDVLATIRRRSLAKLRREVEPVEPPVLGRLVTTWQGVVRPRPGLDALLDAIENLQGAALPASILEREILAARIADYSPTDLDALLAAGEVVWCGLEPLGDRDGRVAMFLTDQLPRLVAPGFSPARAELKVGAIPPAAMADLSACGRAERASERGTASGGGAPRAPMKVGATLPVGDTLPARELAIIELLRARGASFFGAIHEAAGGGYPGETVAAIWNLVWHGIITNDTLHALRAYTHPPGSSRSRRPPPAAGGPTFHSRRVTSFDGLRTPRARRGAPPAAEGRWSLIESRLMSPPASATEWSVAVAQQLLTRYGLITREVATAESLPGGFSAVYDVLRALEDAGRIRRGYFVAGVGATQFALPAALERLRALRTEPDDPEVVHVAATDPANPYGTVLKWPALPSPDAGSISSERGTLRAPSRVVGASIVLVNGAPAVYIGRGGRQILAFLPDDEPARSMVGRAVAERLALIAREGDWRRGGLLVADINGIPAAEHPLAPFLTAAGFYLSALGFQLPRPRARATTH